MNTVPASIAELPLAEVVCSIAAVYFALLLYVDGVSHRLAFLGLAAFVATVTAIVAALLGRVGLVPVAVLVPVAAVVGGVALRRRALAERRAGVLRGAFVLLLAATLVPVWIELASEHLWAPAGGEASADAAGATEESGR